GQPWGLLTSPQDGEPRVQVGLGPEGRVPSGAVLPEGVALAGTAPVPLPDAGALWFGGRPGPLGATDQEILKLMARFVAGELARRQAADSLLQSQLELEHMRSMELIGKLAGGMAHDFKNLAMAVVGCADVALRRLPDPHPARAAVQEVREVAVR